MAALQRAGQDEGRQPLLTPQHTTDSLLASERPFQEGGEEDTDTNQSCVQFTSAVYFGSIAEEQINIDIMRIGFLDTTCTVFYETRDASAKAGVTYEATSGTVTFEPGEYEKSIPLTFVKSGVWSATVELRVALSAPSNCILGKYLHVCRVKVMDEDMFPSNSFLDNKDDIKQVNSFKLYLSYCKWNIRSSGLLCATVATLLCDQLQNLYYLGMVFCDMYLVNTVLNIHAPESDIILDLSRRQCAYGIVMLHIMPWTILVAWEYVKTRLNVEGRSTHMLQRHMYRKFMNLAPDAEANGKGALEYGLLTEAPKVASGFDAGLNLIAKLVNLGLNIFLVAYTRPGALPFVGILILIISLWGLFREALQVPGIRKEQTFVAGMVKETASKHNLICEYLIRPQMNERFEGAAEALRQSQLKKQLHLFRTESLLHVAAPVAAACYMAFSIRHILDGTLAIGTFLGVMAVLRNVAKETCGCYHACQDITHTLAALRNVTTFFNRETEVKSSKKRNRGRRSTSQLLMKEMKIPEVDELPIFCDDMSLLLGENAAILASVNIRLQQGKVVGLFGPNASGKTCLMRLLAQLTPPSTGSVYIPSHLRTLLVTRDVVFLDRSLLVNLTTGNGGNFDNVHRMKKILKSLQLGKLIPLLDRDLADTKKAMEIEDDWSKSLAYADKIRVGLARAFLMNPEVLLLVKPFAQFCSKTTLHVRGLFLEHSKNRGLHMDPATISGRRPRTVIFSTDGEDDCKGADQLWECIPAAEEDQDETPTWTVKVH